MTNLFSWLLRRFLAAFAVLVGVQFLVYIIGLNTILDGYERNRMLQFEHSAVEILSGKVSSSEIDVAPTTPFFVFSVDKEIVFSNKGKGKSIAESELLPIHADGILLGYFYTGEMHFADNRENRIFLLSIIALTGFSIVFSLGIGFIAAYGSSKRIVRPVAEIRADIHKIRGLEPIPERKFRIRELDDIYRDVAEAGLTLRSQEDYKRQWLRDLSHDLRTPLAGLKSQLEAMSDGVLEATPGRFRRHLLEIERLESLAASIGELTAIEDRKSVIKRDVETGRFLEMLISPFEAELQGRSIVLETSDAGGRLYCDESLLLRAAGNILSNAVKYIDDGNLIRVTAAPDRIEIANNGPEIPPEQRELIFTRLYRGDAGRTSPGSGLGLSITREIVQLHGGKVEVNKFEPRGVSFRISLPAAGL